MSRSTLGSHPTLLGRPHVDGIREVVYANTPRTTTPPAPGPGAAEDGGGGAGRGCGRRVTGE
eukprot:1143327-Prymnesium_polylepis.1